MADNAQKTHQARSLNEFAQRKVLAAIHNLGKALPCHVVSRANGGSIVTVAFDVNSSFTLPRVTMPVLMWQWARVPVQLGDKGMSVAADTYLGGISGLGGGTADLTLPANLSSLLFLPVADARWDESENPNAWVIYGPDGAIIRDSDKSVKLQVDGDGNVVLWGMRSLSTDVHGYGTRTTWLGGSNFQVDAYVTGATVSTVTHAYNPPEIPDP